MRILITGAAGNLGCHVVRHLLASPHQLRLLVHTAPLPPDVTGTQVEVLHADLAQPATLVRACDGVDCIVHLAGVLFAPGAKSLLPRTNVEYVRNLLEAASRKAVEKFVLVSFPHVEGDTTPQHPAIGQLITNSDVVHFRTRLAAEKCVIESCRRNGTKAVIFRAGVVYGRGVKLVEAARSLLRRRCLAVWRKPSWIHLIALPDFLSSLRVVIEKYETEGIYQVCDDQPLLLQEFLDRLALHLGYPCPRRLPEWAFHWAGAVCEAAASVLHTSAPLTRDIINAGMTSSVADCSRMKRELLPVLAYPTLADGLELM